MEMLLLASIFLPLAGAAMIWIAPPAVRRAAKQIALLVALATLVLTAALAVQAPSAEDAAGGYFAVTDVAWIGEGATGPDIRFSIGLDGISLWLFALSALLPVTAILVSWDTIDDRAPLFYAMLLLLECGCLGVFAARDIILFYIFFEFTLIPLFFLIGIWGSEERRYAAIKFFLFTLAGSVITFLGIITIVLWVYSNTGEMVFSMPELTARVNPVLASEPGAAPMPPALQVCIFVALFAGFAIKVPLFPLHTWLPLAHVQAPTAGSVFLAGILLKIGTYGFLRFNVPMLPYATALLMPWLLWLSVAGIIYGALVALAQKDMKRLIAYSSVSHLGYCMLGLFALNPLSVQGSLLQMINHGISTGALFALVGMLYERYHTRRIADYGGIARRLPILAAFMLLFTFSSIGLPGLNGFAGEFLILTGMFQRGASTFAGENPWQLQLISVLAVSGVVLGAWYMLSLVRRVFFGPLKEPGAAHTDNGGQVPDLKPREILALAPLAVFVFWIGLQPKTFLDDTSMPLQTATQSARSHLIGPGPYANQTPPDDTEPPREEP